jgi:effector-binding domain-containing protein
MAEPLVVTRGEEWYVGVRAAVTMTTIPQIADRIPVVFGWLGGRGIAPAGAPFLRYRMIDMAGSLVVEAGVPIVDPVDGDGDVFTDVLAAGRYVAVTHVGHFDGLAEATRTLLAWAESQGLDCDVHPSPDGDVWGCRLEVYKTNPIDQPDPSRWETDVAIKLA